jgi:hypothetical protein
MTTTDTAPMRMIAGHPIHPAAELFPMMEGAEWEGFLEDVRRHGFHDPVILDHQGRVLDGRNRLRAAETLGLEDALRVETYKDNTSDPNALLNFIVSANIYRRHLTDKQRAEIAAEIANLGRGGDRKSQPIKPPTGGLKDTGPRRSVKDAAALMNVKPRSVERARAAKRTKKKPTCTTSKPTSKVVTIEKTKPKPKPTIQKPVTTADQHDHKAVQLPTELDRDARFAQFKIELSTTVADLRSHYAWSEREQFLTALEAAFDDISKTTRQLKERFWPARRGSLAAPV